MKNLIIMLFVFLAIWYYIHSKKEAAKNAVLEPAAKIQAKFGNIVLRGDTLTLVDGMPLGNIKDVIIKDGNLVFDKGGVFWGQLIKAPIHKDGRLY